MSLPQAPSFNWAVIGPGRIAHRFAEAVQALPGSRVHAVHGRDVGRAEAFAQAWAREGKGAPPRVHRDLAALLADPDVHGVYIATPHAQHGEPTRACLLAGKPVLCEKPLVASLAEGRALVELARERQVFLMEAVWTRFLPLYAEVIGPWLREGLIGPLRGIQSSFCFPAPYDPENRCFNPHLAGGALLDIGIYNLTVTRWVLQQALGGACPEPEAISALGLRAPTGVDMRVNGTLLFPGGLASQFICSFDATSTNSLVILGERGSITVPRSFSQGTEVILQRQRHGELEHRQAPWRINGFEGEIEEAQACIRAGRIESAVMPLDETLGTLAWMDEMRRQMGVRYPFE